MVRLIDMTVAWTQHRFSGGVLALDTTNTVVLRGDPARRFDRFDDPAEIARFAAAASVFRTRGDRAAAGGRPMPRRSRRTVRGLRESIDALFRRPASGEPLEARALATFLRACAAALDGSEELSASADAPFGEAGAPLPFETALAVSALSLLAAANLRKLKVCPNCTLAVPRQKPQFQPLVVRHGGLRQPREGEAALSPQRQQREKTDG